MNKVDILFNAKLNTKELENSFSEIEEQTVAVGIDPASIKGFEKAKDTIKEITKRIEKLENVKLDVKSFSKEMTDTQKQISVMQDQLKGVVSQLANIAKSIPIEQAEALTNAMSDTVDKATEISRQTQIASDVIESTAKKASKSSLINKNDTEELEKIVGLFKEARDVISGDETFEIGIKENGNTEKRIKDISNRINELIDNYGELISKKQEFSKSGKDTLSEEFADLQVDISYAGKEMLILIDRLKEIDKTINLSDFKIGDIDLDGLKSNVTEDLDGIRKEVESNVTSINESLRQLGTEPVGKNKGKDIDKNISGKPIGVPAYISTGPKALQDQLDGIIDTVQSHVAKNKINVTISLISDYKSTKYKDALEQLHKDVDNIGDEGLKSSFNKLTEQMTSDVVARIKTDVINAEVEIRKMLQRIQRELHKKENLMHVSPEINLKVTKARLREWQKSLNEISKGLTLNIKNVVVSDKAIKEAIGKNNKSKLIDAKSIADTAALANIIDKIIESNKEFMGTNKGVYKSLKEIKDLMNAMPTNKLDEIVEPIKQLVVLMQRFADTLPVTNLDTVFDGMKKDVEEITGSLRNKENLKAIKAILQEYEKYVSMGGTKSITELGGTKNVQNWFKNHYNPTDGQEFGNQYAKGIEESKPQVKNAAEEMVQTAIDATANTQDSHSPSRVADQLGQYWGKGYANGILKTEGDVKDAIRALYEKGKLSFEEIENDRDIHAMISSSVADDIMYDDELSEQTKKFMNIIDILDEYSNKSREANLNSIKGFPEDAQKALWDVATKNLDDIRNVSIDASQAVERLAKAFEEVNENMAKMDADSTSDKIVENVEKEVKAEEKKKEVKKETKKTSEETVEVQKQEQKVVEKVGQTYQKVKDDVEEMSDEMQEAFTKMEHDAIDNIAKSDDDHTMKVLSKYKALPDNAFKGLDKISRGKDEEKAKLANELLDLYGEYNNNPNKTTLSKIYTKTNRSNLSDKMKHSITNHLMKIVEEVNKGATEAVDEAPKTFNKPKTKLISMSKGEYKEFVKNNHLIPMGDSASDFENNFKQHLEGLEEKGLTRSKYDKNGRLRRMQIAVEVLDQDAIDKTEEKVDNVEKKTEEVKTATKEVKEEVANVNKELDKAAEKSNEFTKSIEESAKSVNDIDPEKDLADYNKDISNYVDELMEELNIDDKPIVSNENTEESVSNINKIEDSFKELQEWSSKWIVAGGKNKNYKDGAKKLAAQYAKYKEQGGTQDVEALDKRVTVVRAVRAELEKMSQIESGGNRPISELSDNATVVKNLTEEYEKQIKTIKEDAIAIEDLAKAEKEMIDGISQSDNNVLGINVEEEIKNQNKFQEELKETEQIIKDNHSTSNESSILSDNDEVQKFLASVELLKDSKVYQGIYNVEDNIEGLVDSIKANLMSASEAIEQFVKLSSYDADTENKFKQLQQWSSTNVVASGKNKNLSEQASKLAKQYATYKSIGGIEPLEALDSRKTVIEAVRKEYEKNAQVVNQTAQEEIQAENKIQEELKETQQIIKDNHNTSNESDISSGTESKIQDTKKELLDFYNKLPSVNNAVMDQLDDSINQLEQQIKSGELSAEQALDRLDKKVFEVIESMHEFEKIDLNTSFTHIGSSELNKDKYNNIINSKNPSTINKPSGGFWASPSDNDEWEYIAEEEMGKSAEYLAERFTFKFKENAKVLIIKSLKDIENLPRIESYLDSEGKENTSGRDSQGNILPDWEKISKYYDGILVKINESEDDLYNALYGWDIDSVVVTNPDAIEQIQKETQSVIEDTKAQRELAEVKKESSKQPNETPVSSETKKETSKKKSSKKNENKETDLTVNDTKTVSTATESAEAIKKEAEALEHVETTAKNASKAKDSFAKSNKKVDESAKSSSKSIKEESDSLKDVNKAADKKPKSTYNKEIGYLKQRNKLEQEIARTPNDNINNAPKAERIVQLDEKINALRAERKKLNAEDIEQQAKIDDLLEEHQFKLNQINQQLVQREVNDKKNAIDKNIGSIDKMLISTRYTDSYKEKLSELKNSLLDFKDVLASTDGSDIDKISEDFERLQVEITQTVDVAKQLDINKVINVDAIEKLGVKIANFGDQNTAMGKKFRSQLDEIQKKWEEFKISDNADVNRASLKALNDQFLELERSVSLAGKTGDSFVVGIGKRIKSVTQSAIAMSFSFYDVIRYARELGEVVLQTDTALTELRKVSDAPTARLQQSFEESANTARELGATITDVIDATSAWARMGYNLDASEELARVTTLYKNVGDGITQEEASQSLISTLQGYQMAYTEAEDIIDEFNEVSNNFAITSGGIGESLQRSAAAFNAANTDLSKSIALIAGTK